MCADVLTWRSGAEPYDLAVLAYLQLEASGRRQAVRTASAACARAAPSSSWRTTAATSPKAPAGRRTPRSYTADDVLADLGDASYDVVEAGRVERRVAGPDGSERTAYDALVRVVRTG